MEGVEEGGEQQAGDSWSNTIAVIGHHLFIRCLQLLPRWDYGTIASLNHEFNSVVRNGDIYRLRRKNGVAEHWLYLSCGNNPLGWEAYDPSTRRWIQVPNMPRAQTYDRQEIVVGTEVLVFVAYIRGALRYSILTNSWTKLTDVMKTPWYLFGSASDGEKAYVAGGLDSSHTNVLSSTEMYDSESETHAWTTLPGMNRARYRCSGSFMDGKFYVIGVVSSNREVLTCVVNNELYAADYSENNDLKQYDKLDNKWIPRGKLPVQSTNKGRDMGFRACGDRLIVIGPPNNSSDEKVVELHSWTPDGQPPVWNLFATRPYRGDHWIICTVMGC
ncbi:hypothetical protein ZWY2020_006264 [Hordeum vulgare]|nr:hypothetical protein ZWY2020_006264 [Hordeum vulgare]